ncbi:MAG: cupin domain-containing protein [Alphaproteobacteria bacterium]|nr:cupin domain-containing protein [Alphaproteobacteria bacterium]
MRVRRVVTGHKPDGKATVIIDEDSQDVASFRAGATVWNIWSTESLPADNDDDCDGAKRIRGTALKNGSVFRVIEYAPGVAPRNHRTESIDYAVVLSGAIDMQLDGGEAVQLKAGDVLVQRCTIHNWVNRGTVPCVIAFVLFDAKPVTIRGTQAHAVG